MFVMHSGYFCVELNIFIHFVGVRHKQSNIVEEFFCVGVEAVCVFSDISSIWERKVPGKKTYWVYKYMFWCSYGIGSHCSYRYRQSVFLTVMSICIATYTVFVFCFFVFILNIANGPQLTIKCTIKWKNLNVQEILKHKQKYLFGVDANTCIFAW